MKKGFTLIELLAVIVILAIIAVIAVPIVLNIISESKDNATLRSAEFYLDAVEYTIADAYLNDRGLQDGEYPITPEGNLCKTALPCSEENILKVEVNGEVPTSGTIKIENGQIVSNGTSLIMGENTITIDENGKMVANEPIYICVPVEDSDLTYSDYSGEQQTYTTGSKSVGDAYRCTVGNNLSYIFNVLEISSDNQTVYLLMNHNLVDNIDWYALNGGTGEEKLNSLYNILDTNSMQWTNKKILDITLPTEEQIFNVSSSEWSLDYWLTANNSGYFLSTLRINTSSGCGDVDEPFTVYENLLNSGDYSVCGASFGVRPVIKVSKNSIQ